MNTYFRDKPIENSPKGEKDLFVEVITELQYESDFPLNFVEIGVLNGENVRHLLNYSKTANVTGIDPIIPDSMSPNLVGSLAKIRQNTKKWEDRFNFIQDYSYNVVDRFEDSEIDMLFIDGSHHYNDVLNDFNDYYHKVKSGGFILIHDSRMNRPEGAPFHKGPSKLVDEIIRNQESNGVKLVGESFSLTCFQVI